MNSTVIFDKGDSLYKMWFNIYDGSSFPTLGYATSSDGKQWSLVNSSSMSAGNYGTWDYGYISPGSVITTDDLYYLFYSGGQANTQIGIAQSLDGVTWEKVRTTPILSVGESGEWDSLNVNCPMVFYLDGQPTMLYMGSNSINGQYTRLGLAVPEQ